MSSILLLLVSLVNIGITNAATTCGPHVPPTSGRVVLTYTPYVTPQTGPTSTVYRHIVTAWTYAVDCRYVTISQVDDNQPARGPFTGTPTTVDALTITRIGCIQETLAITRRDVVRGFPVATPVSREGSVDDSIKEPVLQKRATMADNVIHLASKQADEIPPDAQGISVRAYNYLVQVNTALYALNLYNTGFNMSVTCSLLGDPITQARLILASVDPAQAEAIVCYAARYGLYFDMSNAQLLSDLLGIIYSIEVKSGFSTNSTVICNSLQLEAAGYLGIDAQGIQTFICGDQTPANQSTSSITASGTGTIGAAGSTGAPNATVGSLPPFANSTASTRFGTAVPATGTALGSGILSIGTAGSSQTINNASYITPTGTASTSTSFSAGQLPTDSFSIVFPNATAGINGSGLDNGHLPPSPTASLSYAEWITSTTPAPKLPRY